MTAHETRVGTVVIGGGQSGLVMGYYLRRAGEDFVILEAALVPGRELPEDRLELRASDVSVMVGPQNLERLIVAVFVAMRELFDQPRLDAQPHGFC